MVSEHAQENSGTDDGVPGVLAAAAYEPTAPFQFGPNEEEDEEVKDIVCLGRPIGCCANAEILIKADYGTLAGSPGDCSPSESCDGDGCSIGHRTGSESPQEPEPGEAIVACGNCEAPVFVDEVIPAWALPGSGGKIICRNWRAACQQEAIDARVALFRSPPAASCCDQRGRPSEKQARAMCAFGAPHAAAVGDISQNRKWLVAHARMLGVCVNTWTAMRKSALANRAVAETTLNELTRQLVRLVGKMVAEFPSWTHWLAGSQAACPGYVPQERQWAVFALAWFDGELRPLLEYDSGVAPSGG